MCINFTFISADKYNNYCLPFQLDCMAKILEDWLTASTMFPVLDSVCVHVSVNIMYIYV